MLRILIAEDHDIVRRGIRGLLEMQSGWEICGEAANGRDAVQLAAETKPDIAIVDYSLPLLNGLDVVRQIHKLNSKTQILVFTSTTATTSSARPFAPARAASCKRARQPSI